MNATDFVKTFIEITPTKKDYQEKAPDLDSIIDILVNNHKIGKKNVHTDVPEKDAILDLIFIMMYQALRFRILNLTRKTM